MAEYRITIVADVTSSLSKIDLETKLVASLFDIETENKISDGDNKEFEILNYELTDAFALDKPEI